MINHAELEIDEDDFERTPVVQEEGFYAPVIDEEEDLLDESLSLKKLGLSDASLATLASQGEVEDKPKLAEVPLPLVKVSQDDYESLPSYMKSLAPWEDSLLKSIYETNTYFLVIHELISMLYKILLCQGLAFLLSTRLFYQTEHL
ncbi:hypothetical protein DVH24_005199 [Malus domestica]|uniref:Spindle and kinetochore-associated protein 3 n=1 Tax=Malus domestica TaxID=3750 RepID=A0A498IGN5_MALDO|nr:hypothetical protein DVH24_005199 [Malus domestica]